MDPKPVDPDEHRNVSPERDAMIERASIMEYEAGLTREVAERLAKREMEIKRQRRPKQ